MSQLLKTLPRALALVATITLGALGACRTWVPSPAGTTAAPVAAPAFEYPAAVTHANGWRPPGDSSRTRVVAEDAAYETALAAFKQTVARHSPFRVVVYYNSALSSTVEAVRRPAAGVLEMDYEEHGAKGTTSGKKTIRVYADDDASAAPVAAANVDAVMAQRLETAIIGHLVDGNARVMDKGLLFRKVALEKGAPSYSSAELRALSNDVDLVLEVTFVPSATAPDGFELGVRAIRTRDAAILAQVSSAELERRTVTSEHFVAREGGYTPVTETHAVSLRDLCHSVMTQTMTQVASRF